MARSVVASAEPKRSINVRFRFAVALFVFAMATPVRLPAWSTKMRASAVPEVAATPASVTICPPRLNWMIAVPVARDPSESRGARDWVVVVDSNIALEKFAFIDDQPFEKVVSQIRTCAKELWRIADIIREDARELDRQEVGAT